MEGSPLWSHSDYDEREEFARAVKVSLLGVSPIGTSSFTPKESSLAEDWETWCEYPFAEIIGPVFKDAFHLAGKLELREVAELDWMLADHLEKRSQPLIDASRPFIEGKEKMRGHREWRKYTLMLENNEAPGHLPVMFALHSVLFRLPLTCALQAYAWFEWKTGHNSIGKMTLAGYPEEPPPMFLDIKTQIAKIINPGSSADGQPGLRVV